MIELYFYKWSKCVNWQNNYLHPYPDAVKLIKKLHRSGYRLLTITNNTFKMAVDKLTRAGLIDNNKFPIFEKIYGRDVTGSMKDNPEAFKILIKKEKLSPEELIVIGDDPLQDVLIPLSLGIKRIIFVNRKAKDKQMSWQEVFFVKDLWATYRIVKRFATQLKVPSLL